MALCLGRNDAKMQISADSYDSLYGGAIQGAGDGVTPSETNGTVLGSGDAAPVAATETTQERRGRVAVQEEIVRPMLLRANLLRMRGDYIEAVAVCADVLRIAPDSSSAHSLMGDIYDAQGRHSDSAAWFRMAVERNPSSAVDREKLERALFLQSSAVSRADAPTIATAADTSLPLLAADARANRTGSMAAVRAPAEKTMQWFDRIFPPTRADSISRLILAVCGLIALLLFAGAAGLYVMSVKEAGDEQRLANEQERVLPDGPTSTSPIEGSPAAVVESSPTPGGRSPLPQSRPVPAQTAMDDMFRMYLTRLLPKELTLANASIDPRTMYTQAEAIYTAGEEASANPAVLRESVLRAATFVAHATARAEERARRITIRIALRRRPATPTSANGNGVGGGAPQNDTSSSPETFQPQTVFVGDVQASAIRDLEPALLPYASQTALFTDKWWSRDLQPPAPRP